MAYYGDLSRLYCECINVNFVSYHKNLLLYRILLTLMGEGWYNYAYTMVAELMLFRLYNVACWIVHKGGDSIGFCSVTCVMLKFDLTEHLTICYLISE